MNDSERTRELDTMETAECWALLAGDDIGRLAVSIHDHPDLFPVNYAVDGDSIVVNTAPGTKLAAAVLGRAVAFEVDQLDRATRTGWSVVVKGRAREIEDLDGLMSAEDLGIRPWADTDKTRYMRITVDEITGRRIG